MSNVQAPKLSHPRLPQSHPPVPLGSLSSSLFFHIILFIFLICFFYYLFFFSCSGFDAGTLHQAARRGFVLLVTPLAYAGRWAYAHCGNLRLLSPHRSVLLVCPHAASPGSPGLLRASEMGVPGKGVPEKSWTFRIFEYFYVF